MQNSRSVQLAMFAMVVFGGVETAFANPTYSFTTIDVPGASITGASGINNSGQIVGTFRDALAYHGFLDTGGSFTTIDFVPEYFGLYTGASVINDSGQIVGVGSIDGCDDDGFVYTGGNFTTINFPGATTGSSARGINNSGQIVGGFGDASGAHGFVDRGGSFTTIDVPGATYTAAFGINDSGQIVGYFDDATGRHGFVDTGGRFTTFDVPGATQTIAAGINNSGQIVGTFTDATGTHGFLATPVGGASPDGSIITPTSGQLIDSAGATWEWGGPSGSDYVTIRNSDSGQNGGSAVKMEVANGGKLYAYDSGAHWWLYSSGSWSNVTSGSHP